MGHRLQAGAVLLNSSLENWTLTGTMGNGREEEEHGYTGKKDLHKQAAETDTLQPPTASKPS